MSVTWGYGKRGGTTDKIKLLVLVYIRNDLFKTS